LFASLSFKFIFFSSTRQPQVNTSGSSGYSSAAGSTIGSASSSTAGGAGAGSSGTGAAGSSGPGSASSGGTVGPAVLQIQFLINEGALITATADDTIHLWNIRQKRPEIVHSLKFQRERSAPVTFKILLKYQCGATVTGLRSGSLLSFNFNLHIWIAN